MASDSDRLIESAKRNLKQAAENLHEVMGIQLEHDFHEYDDSYVEKISAAVQEITKIKNSI